MTWVSWRWPVRVLAEVLRQVDHVLVLATRLARLVQLEVFLLGPVEHLRRTRPPSNEEEHALHCGYSCRNQEATVSVERAQRSACEEIIPVAASATNGRRSDKAPWNSGSLRAGYCIGSWMTPDGAAGLKLLGVAELVEASLLVSAMCSNPRW